MIKKRFDIKDEKSVKPKGSVYRHLDDAVAIFSSWVSANIQVTLWNFYTHFRGKYRFRISAYAFQTDKPVTFHVTAGTLPGGDRGTHHRLLRSAARQADRDRVRRAARREELRADCRGRAGGDSARGREDRRGELQGAGPGRAVGRDRRTAARHLAAAEPSPVFGDLAQARMPTATDREHMEVVSKQPMADAERLLTRLHAPGLPADSDRRGRQAVPRAREGQAGREVLVRAGDARRPQGRAGVAGFLFLREKPGKLDDFALASRLSYFLWSSMPDEELLTLAEQGKLNQPDTLRAQVERMLKDPKAAAFTENFVGQWLGLRNIDATAPDPTLYPEYDDMLKVAMVKETVLFFDEVLKNDLSLTNFVASDFTMLNGRLAKHYGIPGVTGHGVPQGEAAAGQPPRRRADDGERAEGDGQRHHDLAGTARGLGARPHPGHAAAEADGGRGGRRAGHSRRHDDPRATRQAPRPRRCASCHAKIDPPGFALESFDVIGGWRDYYRSVGKGEPAIVNGRTMRYKKGLQVDAADVLPDGQKFRNIDEFKQLLLKDKDQLARALTEKLLTYATGAAPGEGRSAGDRWRSSRRFATKNYGLRTLVHEIVQSKVFQSK